MNHVSAGILAKFGPVSRALAAAIALASAAAPAAHAADSDVARSAEGIKIAPVTLNLKGLNKASVGLGSYLVTVGQCADCHSVPNFASGGDPFMGQKAVVNKATYFSGGGNFGGGICSSNITPDKNGLPDGLTQAHFISAMQTGHDFRAKPKVLLQIMPWPDFRDMTVTDLTAMYDYLRAIPPLKEPKCP